MLSEAAPGEAVDELGFVVGRSWAEWEAIQPTSPTSRRWADDGDLAVLEGGLPAQMRQEIWLVTSGASEARQARGGADYYRGLVERAGEVREETARQVELDLGRTFSEDKTHISTRQGQDKLRRVLLAYALHDQLVGYCQSLNFLAGLLLCVLEEEAAFWLLSCLCRKCFYGYHVPSMIGIRADMAVMDELVAAQLPGVAERLERLDVPLPLIVAQNFMQLYITLLPSHTVLCLMDAIFLNLSLVDAKADSSPVALGMLSAVTLALLRSMPEQLWGRDASDFKNGFSQHMADFHDSDRLLRLASAERAQLAGGLSWEERLAEMKRRHWVQLSEQAEKELMLSELGAVLLLERKIGGQSALSASALHAQFMAAKSELELPDCWALPRQRFEAMLQSVAPGELDPGLADSLFEVCSTDGQRADFRMVVATLGCLGSEGTLDERLLLLFRLFDLDGNGVIDMGEFTCIVEVLHRLQRIPANKAWIEFHAQVAFSQFGADQTSELSFEHFKSVLEAMPLARQFLKIQPNPPGNDASRGWLDRAKHKIAGAFPSIFSKCSPPSSPNAKELSIRSCRSSTEVGSAPMPEFVLNRDCSLALEAQRKKELMERVIGKWQATLESCSQELSAGWRRLRERTSLRGQLKRFVRMKAEFETRWLEHLAANGPLDITHSVEVGTVLTGIVLHPSTLCSKLELANCLGVRQHSGHLHLEELAAYFALCGHSSTNSRFPHGFTRNRRLIGLLGTGQVEHLFTNVPEPKEWITIPYKGRKSLRQE